MRQSVRALRARRRNIRRAIMARKMMGGFALAPALMAADAFGKAYKPLTRAEELAKSIGVADRISSFVDKLPGGGILKGLFRFGKSQLGYGRKKRRYRRRHAMGGKRMYRRRHRVRRGGIRRRARKHRVRGHMRKIAGGRRIRVRGHMQRKPRRR